MNLSLWRSNQLATDPVIYKLVNDVIEAVCHICEVPLGPELHSDRYHIICGTESQ